jgi:hypothetical protein
VVFFFNNPSISMSYNCGMFNRSPMSQKTLMHPNQALFYTLEFEA